MLRPAQWRQLVARTSGWTPSAYIPLRIGLNAVEQQRLSVEKQEGHDWGGHAASTHVLGSSINQNDTVLMGWVRLDHVEGLRRFKQVFQISESSILIPPIFESPAERTAAFRTMSEILRAEGAFPLWQNEIYAAKRLFMNVPLMYYQRGTASHFGFPHATKNRWPGLLDTIAGGGLPAHTSAHENMVKEAQEEAGLEPNWTHPRLVSSGSISYLLDDVSGLQNNTMFVYDLEVPDGFVPCNTDNEVESFELWPVGELVSALGDGMERFKPDVCLVLLDFFLRHGVLTPDNFRDHQYLDYILRGSPVVL